MSYQFKVAVEVDLIDGLQPVFMHQNGPNPFDIGEWPDIRRNLEDKIEDDIPDEFESYLHSNRTGESYQYTVGTITVSDTGELLERNLDLSVASLKQAFEEQN